MEIPVQERRLSGLIRLFEQAWLESDIEVTEIEPRPSMAFLLAGSDEDSVTDLQEMKVFLEQTGCQVVFRKESEDVKDSFRLLKRLVQESDGFRPLLVAFSGHGGTIGWEGREGKPKFRYSRIARIICAFKGPLFVINDTCFGVTLLPYLWANRHPRMTGFLAPWNGHHICNGGPIKEILQAWPKEKFPEELLGETRTVTSDSGDEYAVARHLRWGARLDHHFFSPLAPSSK